MSINIENVNYIAKLSKLKFEEDEASVFAKEFENILEQFKILDEMNLDNVAEIRLSVAVIRKDNAKPCEIEELFSNVKSVRDTYIEVPKIIE
ncbi:Asp-tRNA(Asn)/Glu-tRNA(Gln) amidotransferase subunit GatC [Romboutsia sp.]|uniref:Asp-tRNA(Asn)/Glu-tRNA(Gln) amidotransferase subunit GatC n=1 Tax=Romboutsia sp. TaxID=1965302 RepID=UPI003F359303